VISAVSVPVANAAILAARVPTARPIPDLEEILADPQIEAVIVADTLEERAVQLRRALQSERHVLCTYPIDRAPDLAYEAAMLQADARCILLPLMPDALDPAVVRLAEWISLNKAGNSLQLIRMEGWLSSAVCLEARRVSDGANPMGLLSFTGWDVLRRLGGEIAEVSALGRREEAVTNEALLVTGRFDQDGLFESVFLPIKGGQERRLIVFGDKSRAELTFPVHSHARAILYSQDRTGKSNQEGFESWDPWLALVKVFESALIAGPPPNSTGARGVSPPLQNDLVSGGARHEPARGQPVTWQTAIRALELDDAVRRSLARRRVSVLEYPEPTEEVGFKGTMTLVGCSVLWVVLTLLILSRWAPWAGWLIVPILIVFLGLQLLRWIVPSDRDK
jgi:predicted dehydrogenase